MVSFSIGDGIFYFFSFRKGDFLSIFFLRVWIRNYISVCIGFSRGVRSSVVEGIVDRVVDRFYSISSWIGKRGFVICVGRVGNRVF